MKKDISHLLFVFSIFFYTACSNVQSESKADVAVTRSEPAKKGIDTAAYDKIIAAISNGDTSGKWPV